jgi:hypothetical protein
MLRKTQEAVIDILNKESALIQAFDSNDIKRVRRLLQSGADPDVQKHGSGTLLQCAVKSSRHNRVNIGIAALLLLYGAKEDVAGLYQAPDETASDNFCKTESPLDDAISSNDVEKVRELIQSGTDPNKLSRDSGWTPLNQALITGGIRIAALLLRHGADTKLCNRNDGNSVEDNIISAVYRFRLEVAKTLSSAENSVIEVQMQSFFLGRHNRVGRGSPVQLLYNDIIGIICRSTSATPSPFVKEAIGKNIVQLSSERT